MKTARRILHVITGLETGGAELCLVRIASHLKEYRHEVISLTGRGRLAGMLEPAGIGVRALNLERGRVTADGLVRLARWIAGARAELVQTWMYHANLLGGVVTRLVSSAPVVWSVHHSNLDPEANRRSTLWTARACGRLSRRVPERLLFVSRAALEIHASAMGYAAERSRVIPNGVDTTVFRPDETARLRLRAELGLEAETRLVGLVARWDPLKDHANFLDAAARLGAGATSAAQGDVAAQTRFVLAGDGIEESNPDLVGMIAARGLADRCFLLGRRDPVSAVMQGLDVLCLASRGEAFPNVLVEAMACGVPAVATDVGDCAWVIGDTGLVTPARDSGALAGSLGRVIELGRGEWRAWGARARARVERLFELSSVARRYAELYEEIWSTPKSIAAAAWSR